jgi:hypothetical protein
MGTTAAGDKSVSLRVVDFGTTHIGKRVGKNATCWDLPFAALQHAGAKTPWDLHDTYVWGTLIPDLKDAQPGDILQFEGVHIKRSWTLPDGRPAWETLDFGQRHSAIIQKVDKELFFTTLNQHVIYKGSSKNKFKVQIIPMNLSPENIQSGTIKLYRPIPK